MPKVIDFPLQLNPGETYADIDPDKVLMGVVGKLSEVVVVGYENDGTFYFASTRANGPDVLWLLKLAEKRLLDIEKE